MQVRRMARAIRSTSAIATLPSVSNRWPSWAMYLGSSLFSVGNGQVEFGGSEVKHGDEILDGAEAAGLPFDGGEDAVETFEEGVGGAPHPMAEDARQMTGDHVGTFAHVGEERSPVLAGGSYADGARVPRILDGSALPDSPRPLRLHHVLEEDGTLFLSYRAG